ncbi:NAD-dependent epimerase/dehydratase family protein [Jiangella asiatica]|uniref:NAD(P)-dependent oxidoreductase n=1 Tax=Jiangella asiatica TaxID=2530372 RepID=A0A4R5DRU6_9ACTN|nr:NAD(P)-dependent oxidoreductase [Jiangella asiatica]TDE15044.1 NAD(P)-dependent oxidoreductase [Jiangella asiatica]
MTTVLVTGAAGRVAQQLRPGLDGVDGLTLRAVDVREVTGWDGAETAVGDLTDAAFTAAAVAGVDAVVHLAANPRPEAAWPELRGPNVDAVVTLLDTASTAGVRKVVLASSVHAMGGYVQPGGPVVDPSWPVRPCCRYGSSKAFAEAYGRMVADAGGPAVICLRLGGCVPEPGDLGTTIGWLAPGDLHQLVRAALAADVRYGTYFGVSANTRGMFDYTNATRELSYRPRFDSEVYVPGLPDGDGGLCRWAATDT